MQKQYLLLLMAVLFCSYFGYKHFFNAQSEFDKQLNAISIEMQPDFEFSAALIPLLKSCNNISGLETNSDWDEVGIRVGQLEAMTDALPSSKSSETELKTRLALQIARMKKNVESASTKKLAYDAAKDKSWYEAWKNPQARLAEYNAVIGAIRTSITAYKSALAAHGKSVTDRLGGKVAKLNDEDLDKEEVQTSLESFSRDLDASVTGYAQSSVDASDEEMGKAVSAIFGKGLTVGALEGHYKKGTIKAGKRAKN
jgi:hypothetical protein